MTGPRPRVLVVDDDAVFRITVQRALDGRCEVVQAASVEEAEAAVAADTFDCVLLDHLMPGRTGLELAPPIIARGIAVVLLTAAGDEQVAVEALKLGCRDYVRKRDLEADELWRSVLRAIESQRRESELLRTRRELESFVNVAAHDLKAPARQIRGFAELAIEALEEGNTEELIHHLRFMESSAKRMFDLVLALHRHTQIGIEPLKREAFALDAEVDELFVAARASAPSDVTFTRDALPEVEADRVSIAQVLQNLIENAVKFRGPAPLTVHVSGGFDGQQWRVSVADDGQGIPADSQALVFEPLRRLSPKSVEGSGLGLATCRKIMREHGGDIALESELGVGSTFTIRWPAATKVGALAT